MKGMYNDIDNVYIAAYMYKVFSFSMFRKDAPVATSLA